MHDITQLESLWTRLNSGHSIDRQDIEAINRITHNDFPLSDLPTEAERETLLGAVNQALKQARAGRIERKH